MNKKIIVGGIAAVAAAALLAGCTQSAPEPTTNLPNESASPVTPEQPETDWANIEAFLQAQDAPGQPQFAGLVAPGSPAERWVEFSTDTYNAEVAAGAAGDYYPSTSSYKIDKETGIVTETIKTDGYPDTVVQFTNWVTDEEGRIVTYADANGVPLEDRLWTKEPSGAAAGETVQVISAFRTTYGNMTINVLVTTDGEFTDFDASYVGPDGIARKSSWNTAGTAVQGATNLVTYTFEQAPFGGKFIYNASGEWDTVPITLVIE